MQTKIIKANSLHELEYQVYDLISNQSSKWQLLTGIKVFEDKVNNKTKYMITLYRETN